MATADIRFKRVNAEYQSVRDAQDELFDKVDTFEEALLGLTEMVAENQRQIVENQRQILALHEKVDALMVHLEVPHKPTGFIKD